ncbi:MAG: hypothetical protein GTO03_01380 [Planctomycetales bacterium]|nr:hypothetical protein [Planctomycetales bacterium]
MKIVMRAALILFAAGCLLLVAGEGRAENELGCGYGCWGDGYYYGFYRRRITSDQQLPPYFSQFPPVYYSGPPIARTYGWSPFALRPTEYGQIPQLKAKPVMVDNPYVRDQDDAADPKLGDKAAAAPRRMANPFVPDEGTARVAAHGWQR